MMKALRILLTRYAPPFVLGTGVCYIIAAWPCAFDLVVMPFLGFGVLLTTLTYLKLRSKLLRSTNVLSDTLSMTALLALLSFAILCALTLLSEYRSGSSGEDWTYRDIVYLFVSILGLGLVDVSVVVVNLRNDSTTVDH